MLSLLVALHEFGHAIVAHRNGVKVEEYAIGFPPKLWSKKLKSGTEFRLNALPIGGYVKLQGEYDSARGKGDYGNAGYKAKSKILFAGVTLNFLLAWVIFAILGVFGMPKVIDNQFRFKDDKVVSTPVLAVSLEENGPAALAGVEEGDEIIYLAGEAVVSPARLTELAEVNASKAVALVLKRDGQEKTLTVNIRGDDKQDNQGFIGIYPGQQSYIKTPWYKAPSFGLVTTAQLSWETLKGVGNLVTDFFGGLLQKVNLDPAVRDEGGKSLARAGESVAGPIAMLGLIFPALISTNSTTFFFFVGMISMTLAVMNLLPIPGLDGGRWLLMTIFKLIKKPLDKETEGRVQAFGTMLLFGIMIVVIISDVIKII